MPLELRAGSTIILGPQIGSNLIVHLEQPLMPLEVENLKHGLAAVYIEGIIEYTDIFKKAHTTYSRFMHHANNGKIGTSTALVFCPEGNYGD